MASAQVDDIADILGPGNFRRLSRMTGISIHHVSRVLRGLREPSFDVAVVISSAAGVTLEQFRSYTYQFRNNIRTANPVYEDADD